MFARYRQTLITVAVLVAIALGAWASIQLHNMSVISIWASRVEGRLQAIEKRLPPPAPVVPAPSK